MAYSKVVRGEGAEVYILGNPYGMVPSGAFTTTAAVTSGPVEIAEVDGISLHLIVDYEQDPVSVIAGTDAVVASTGVWTFGNYTFTGLVGAQLVVSGATNAGNNGTFAITAVGTHTATTATTGLVNETFGTGVVVYVIRSEAASVPQGSWTIQGSNDFVQGDILQYGFPGQAGHFPDVSALFSSPSPISAVATASSQIVQPQSHCSFKAIRATFTPTAGKGTARCALFGKSWSR